MHVHTRLASQIILQLLACTSYVFENVTCFNTSMKTTKTKQILLLKAAKTKQILLLKAEKTKQILLLKAEKNKTNPVIESRKNETNRRL